MDAVLDCAIEAIDRIGSRIDPVDQVVLAVKYGIPEWLPAAYSAIGERKEPLTSDEGNKLGMDTAMKLAEVREKVVKSTHSNGSPARLPRALRVDYIVDRVFWPRPSGSEPRPEKSEPTTPDSPSKPPYSRTMRL